MPCYHPITLPDRSTGLLNRFRCGKCRYCRSRRRFQWIGRLRLEAQDHAHCRFVTLTYRVDPDVLDVGHLQDFLKRFRYHHGGLRYLAVGEYGEKSGRGHWHLITFGPNLPLGTDALRKEVWPYGFHLVGTCTIPSMAYVASYCMKVMPRNSEKRPIMRMSLRPGIGFSRLGALAEVAARSPLRTWPLHFHIGADRYPFTDGGLRHFQKKYLEFGGLPVASLSPNERDMVARAALKDEGTQIEERRNVRREFIEKGRDVHAIKEEKQRPL